jgi:hypothetical protein
LARQETLHSRRCGLPGPRESRLERFAPERYSAVAMKRLLLPGLLFLCPACVAAMHGSNRSAEPQAPASIRFAGAPDDALLWLIAEFHAAGYPTTGQYGKAPNTVYVFQGERGMVLAEGGVFWGRKGRAPSVNMNDPIVVGSIFYVYLESGQDGATYITLYGKPTIAEHELCGGDDGRWSLPCEEVEAPKDWKGRKLLDGSTEATVVKKLIADLEGHAPATSAAVATFTPPPTLSPPPEVLGANCYWDYSPGSGFQRRVCQGEEKTAMEQRQMDQLENGPTVKTNGPNQGQVNRYLGDTFGD